MSSMALEPGSDTVTATVSTAAVECSTANNTDSAEPACIPVG